MVYYQAGFTLFFQQIVFEKYIPSQLHVASGSNVLDNLALFPWL